MLNTKYFFFSFFVKNARKNSVLKNIYITAKMTTRTSMMLLLSSSFRYVLFWYVFVKMLKEMTNNACNVVCHFFLISNFCSCENNNGIVVFQRTPSSLMDSIANPKMKIVEGERVGAFPSSHHFGGKGACAGTLGWGLRRLTNNSITHTDLHKPNNKLVSA